MYLATRTHLVPRFTNWYRGEKHGMLTKSLYEERKRKIPDFNKDHGNRTPAPSTPKRNQLKIKPSDHWHWLRTINWKQTETLRNWIQQYLKRLQSDQVRFTIGMQGMVY